jgi:hydrogenase nickel incorporation protein HypB
MCETCGCGLPGETPVTVSDHHHDHDHDHDHSHGHETHHHEPGHEGRHHPPGERETLDLRHSILDKNDRLAERNRGFFHARGLLVLNIVSAPGSGKTTLIGQTIRRLGERLKTAVIVGDLATDNDARRLRETGAQVIQVNTGTLCHLDAEMIARSVKLLRLDGVGLLIIENVGNLVCPASFDLGEDLRVALLSVADGEDKPLKYPPVFHTAGVVIISKSDLGGACDFNREAAVSNVRHIAPKAVLFETSGKTGAGIDAWCDYLVQEHQKIKERDPLSDLTEPPGRKEPAPGPETF